MSTQFSQNKTHKFYLNFGELGKFEPKVSDKKMKELLFLLFPNYENLTREAKQKAWKELRRVVYNKLKKGYEKKYSDSAVRFSRVDTWQNSLYTKETSNA
jgi:exonuclease I